MHTVGESGEAGSDWRRQAESGRRVDDWTEQVMVRMPAKQLNLDQAFEVLKAVLGRAGCSGCFSGFAIHFINEVDFVVN
jgi:hypothetical protein